MSLLSHQARGKEVAALAHEDSIGGRIDTEHEELA
jgi:hypothetical protein